MYSNKFCAQHLHFHRQFKVKLNKFKKRQKPIKNNAYLHWCPSRWRLFAAFLLFGYHIGINTFVCALVMTNEKKEMKMETQCFSQCFNFVFVCAKSAYIQHQLSYFVRSSFFFVQLSFFFHNNQIDKSWNRKQIFEENKNVRELTGLLAISRQNLQPINILNSSFALVIIIFVVVYFFCAFQT